MVVKELIEKLREYPADATLDAREVGVGKIILVVDGRELDPVFQIKGPLQRGFGARLADANA
jgi:hypothetical protein